MKFTHLHFRLLLLCSILFAIGFTIHAQKTQKNNAKSVLGNSTCQYPVDKYQCGASLDAGSREIYTLPLRGQSGHVEFTTPAQKVTECPVTQECGVENGCIVCMDRKPQPLQTCLQKYPPPDGKTTSCLPTSRCNGEKLDAKGTACALSYNPNDPYICCQEPETEENVCSTNAPTNCPDTTRFSNDCTKRGGTPNLNTCDICECSDGGNVSRFGVLKCGEEGPLVDPYLVETYSADLIPNPQKFDRQNQLCNEKGGTLYLPSTKYDQCLCTDPEGNIIKVIDTNGAEACPGAEPPAVEQAPICSFAEQEACEINCANKNGTCKGGNGCDTCTCLDGSEIPSIGNRACPTNCGNKNCTVGEVCEGEGTPYATCKTIGSVDKGKPCLTSQVCKGDLVCAGYVCTCPDGTRWKEELEQCVSK